MGQKHSNYPFLKTLERCYREDSFSSYELSILPSGKIEERGLTLDNKGIGRLVDGNIDQYMKFKGQNLIVTMSWDSPTNISGKMSPSWLSPNWLLAVLGKRFQTDHLVRGPLV